MTDQSFLEFRSRVDAWMGWLVLGSCALLLGSCLVVLVDEASGALFMVAVVLLTIIVVPLLLWTLYGTQYRLTEKYLLISSGPVKTRIKLDDILSIEPTRSFQTGPAFSRDRFLVRYDRFATVMISPVERGRFLHEIANRTPHLVWRDEKLVTLS